MQILIILTTLLLSRQVYAHGEDKVGPHGGFIRMPGAFHTELVPSGNNAFKVYLLDMDWKNPSVKDAKVKLTFKGMKNMNSNCVEKANFYLCKFDKIFKPKNVGELILETTREAQAGDPVFYSLPLKN